MEYLDVDLIFYPSTLQPSNEDRVTRKLLMRDNWNFYPKCDRLPTPSQKPWKILTKNIRKNTHIYYLYSRDEAEGGFAAFSTSLHSESNWININIYLSSSDCCLHFEPTIVSASLKFRASHFLRRSTRKVRAPFATLACPQDSQISVRIFSQIKVKAFRWPLRNFAISRQAVRTRGLEIGK